jgi:hypothetical protein
MDPDCRFEIVRVDVSITLREIGRADSACARNAIFTIVTEQARKWSGPRPSLCPAQMSGAGATATSSVVVGNVCFQAVAKPISTTDIGRIADRGPTNRAEPLVVRPPSPRLVRAHLLHPHRDTALCSRSWCGRAGSEPHGDCPSPCR